MKKFSALLLGSVILGLGVASNASAGEPPPQARAINPAVIAQFVNWTWAKGTIKVPVGAATGQLAGLTCADITVTATSQDQKPPPPGGLFSSPKWQHSVHATGTWSSGSCTYAVTVVPGIGSSGLNEGDENPCFDTII